MRWPICPARWPRVGSACVDKCPSPKTDVLVIKNPTIFEHIIPVSVDIEPILEKFLTCCTKKAHYSNCSVCVAILV